jgi:hypothetical protein
MSTVSSNGCGAMSSNGYYGGVPSSSVSNDLTNVLAQFLQSVSDILNQASQSVGSGGTPVPSAPVSTTPSSGTTPACGGHRRHGIGGILQSLIELLQSLTQLLRARANGSPTTATPTATTLAAQLPQSSAAVGVPTAGVAGAAAPSAGTSPLSFTVPPGSTVTITVTPPSTAQVGAPVTAGTAPIIAGAGTGAGVGAPIGTPTTAVNAAPPPITGDTALQTSANDWANSYASQSAPWSNASDLTQYRKLYSIFQTGEIRVS